MAGLTVAFQALLAGESLVLPSTADPSTLLDAIAIAGVTNVSLTPFLAQLVLRSAKRRTNAPPTHLLFAGIGGGPVVPALPGEAKLRSAARLPWATERPKRVARSPWVASPIRPRYGTTRSVARCPESS